jgi:uncharacterized protein YbaR (Trm112 family)
VSVFGCPVTCPQCAGPLDLLNGTANGIYSVSILRCEPCKREYEIRAYLRPLAVPTARADRRRAQREEAA